VTAEREIATSRAWILAAPRRGAATAEVRATDRASISRGKVRLEVRMRLSALPLKGGAFDHVVAVGFVRAAVGDARLDAFREVQRVLRDEGSFIYGEPDADGGFAKDHVALREMGFVPAPMDTIPELSHVPWRLLAAFKPLTKSQSAAERGHETH
jgi:SAM-dependent methyltransferase